MRLLNSGCCGLFEKGYPFYSVSGLSSSSSPYFHKLKPKIAIAAGRQPGRARGWSETKALDIERNYLRRAVTLMPLLTGAVDSIQTGLELLIGVRRSLGYISQTLQAAGAAAEAYNEGLRVPVAVLGEADEIFAGRKPCLTVVDRHSLLVLNLSPANGREATHWGLTFLELADQGLVFQDVAADGTGGIRAGLRVAQLNLPLRPDLFHLLREAKRLQNRLEKSAYNAIRTAERAQQAEQEARQPSRRKGRPLKVEFSVEETTQKEQQTLATHDNFAWLMSDIRQVPEPITTDHRIQSTHQAQQTLQAAIQLLESLPGELLAAFTRQFWATTWMYCSLRWSGCTRRLRFGPNTCHQPEKPG